MESQKNEKVSSVIPSEHVESHHRKLYSTSAPTSHRHQLGKKRTRFLNSRASDYGQVYKSLPVSNAVELLKLVGGNNSEHFELSKRFLHSVSKSPFPFNTGKRAVKFFAWLQERDKDLTEVGTDLVEDLQCGDIFHLFALVSSGELSISPCLPDNSVGEAEDLRNAKC
ncbi:hypothetical protein RIF29_14820 [Crotalaria pallida]|uniref:Uncharacterized protein n=1 Tax=Crotalaria pallida TaxID=3830 RepID=A0AAN9IC10_CROPI